MGISIIGIESSCDDSSVAIYTTDVGIESYASFAQTKIHSPYKGVVPELAARDHASKLIMLLQSISLQKSPDAVACTTGPGLAGCLAAGTSIAQSIAWTWGVPFAQVNHLEGHLLSPFLQPNKDFDYPYLCLLVSGGHTSIYDVVAPQQYFQLGTTLDDAAGEAFDKTGILLGLDFPGGPQLEQLAKLGNADNAPLKPAMLKSSTYDVSFSGLKTAARKLLTSNIKKEDIAASFQNALISTLTNKVELALKNTGRKRVAIVGGVGQNAALRSSLANTLTKYNAKLFHPPLKWCGDNAAMIAYAGQYNLEQTYSSVIRPRWPVGQ